MFAHALIDPSSEFAVELQETLGSDLSRWRRLVLDEIKELKKNVRRKLRRGFGSYRHIVGSPTKIVCFPSVPLLRRLGEIIGFPGLDELVGDISRFSLLVRLEPGSYWENKGVWKPEQVLGKEEFFTRNLEYINMHLLLVPLITMHNPCWLQLPKK